jgi:SAM-dependent MidA family methyltransferase
VLVRSLASCLPSNSPNGWTPIVLAAIQFVEAGPHNGLLAADILDWTSRHRPDLFERMEYCLLDASPARRAWQEETLRSWLPKCEVGADIESLAVIGRRLGSYFPTNFWMLSPSIVWLGRRAAAMAGRLRNGPGAAFAWEWLNPPPELAAHLPQVPGPLAGVLPDGFTMEVCPAAVAWWRAAAAKLRRGKLLTLDYGLLAEERFRPERAKGTLRAFTRHHAIADVLGQPGEQDLTAHVNFSALMEAGRAAGLRTEALARQSKFLTEIFARTRLDPEFF